MSSLRRIGAWLAEKLFLLHLSWLESMYSYYLTGDEYEALKMDRERQGIRLPRGSFAEAISKLPRRRS